VGSPGRDQEEGRQFTDGVEFEFEFEFEFQFQFQFQL
jgi:hypothetical protein